MKKCAHFILGVQKRLDGSRYIFSIFIICTDQIADTKNSGPDSIAGYVNIIESNERNRNNFTLKHNKILLKYYFPKLKFYILSTYYICKPLWTTHIAT